MTNDHEPTPISAGYTPNATEPFMCERQVEWFRTKLIAMQEEILKAADETLGALRDTSTNAPDANDRASSASDWATELRTRDRQRKLLGKISMALSRIADGEYGWCIVTGEPIPIARLVARPIASMTIEAQERYEHREKMSRAA